MVIRFSPALLLLLSFFLSSGAQTDEGAGPAPPVGEPATGTGRCVFTEKTLAAAVNASSNGRLTRITVNCLSFKDSNRNLRNAIVSVIEDGTRRRFFATCTNGVLVLTESGVAYTTTQVYCSDCRDTTSLCATGRWITIKFTRMEQNVCSRDDRN